MGKTNFEETFLNLRQGGMSINPNPRGQGGMSIKNKLFTLWPGQNPFVHFGGLKHFLFNFQILSLAIVFWTRRKVLANYQQKHGNF